MFAKQRNHKRFFVLLVILFAFGFDNSQIAQAQLTRSPIDSTDWRVVREKWLGGRLDLLLGICEVAREVRNANGYSAYSNDSINVMRRGYVKSVRKHGWYLTERQLGAAVSGEIHAMKTACPDIW